MTPSNRVPIGPRDNDFFFHTWRQTHEMARTIQFRHEVQRYDSA